MSLKYLALCLLKHSGQLTMVNRRGARLAQVLTTELTDIYCYIAGVLVTDFSAISLLRLLLVLLPVLVSSAVMGWLFLIIVIVWGNPFRAPALLIIH